MDRSWTSYYDHGMTHVLIERDGPHQTTLPWTIKRDPFAYSEDERFRVFEGWQVIYRCRSLPLAKKYVIGLAGQAHKKEDEQWKKGA